MPPSPPSPDPLHFLLPPLPFLCLSPFVLTQYPLQVQMSRCTFWIQVAIVSSNPSLSPLPFFPAGPSRLMRVLCCARSARDFPLQFPTEWIALPFANNPQRQLAKMQLKNFTLSTLCPRCFTVPLSKWVCVCVCVCAMAPLDLLGISLTAAEPGMTLVLALEVGKHSSI